MKKVPERIMKHLAKKILKNVEKESGQVPEGINTNIPDYKEIEDHKEAKETMKNYLENMMTEVDYTVDKKYKKNSKGQEVFCYTFIL